MSELIYIPPIDQFINEINTVNEGLKNNPLTVDDVTIIDNSPEFEYGPVREVILKATGSSKFHGSVEDPGIKYQRYDWDRLFKQVPVIYMTGEPTIGEAIAEFSSRYNIPEFIFTGDTADFTSALALNDKVIYNEENYADLSFGFAPSSVGYIGMFKLRVYNDVNNLSTVIINRNLTGLKYPDNTKGELGSLSLLTTPVKFAFEKDKLPILSKVGSGLNGYLLDSIAKQVAAYYNDPVGLERDLKAALVNHKVKTTNVSAEGASLDEEPLLVTLYGSTAFVSWIGTVILNIVEFK